jgi:hypothetical protein
VPGRFRGMRSSFDHGGAARERWENGAGLSAVQPDFPLPFPPPASLYQPSRCAFKQLYFNA